MPRYHFNVHNGLGATPDEEGRELADLEAARTEAVKGARGLIAEDVLQGRLDLDGRIEVVDAKGALLLTLAFGEAIERRGGA